MNDFCERNVSAITIDKSTYSHNHFEGELVDPYGRHVFLNHVYVCLIIRSTNNRH